MSCAGSPLGAGVGGATPGAGATPRGGATPGASDGGGATSGAGGWHRASPVAAAAAAWRRAATGEGRRASAAAAWCRAAAGAWRRTAGTWRCRWRPALCHR